MPWQVVSNYDYTKSHTIKDWGWEFTVKHADRVLHGMGGWESLPEDDSKPDNSQSGKAGAARPGPERRKNPKGKK